MSYIELCSYLGNIRPRFYPEIIKDPHLVFVNLRPKNLYIKVKRNSDGRHPKSMPGLLQKLPSKSCILPPEQWPKPWSSDYSTSYIRRFSCWCESLEHLKKCKRFDERHSVVVHEVPRSVQIFIHIWVSGDIHCLHDRIWHSLCNISVYPTTCASGILENGQESMQRPQTKTLVICCRLPVI